MVWGPGTCETSTCWRTWWQRADHPWVEHLLQGMDWWMAEAFKIPQEISTLRVHHMCRVQIEVAWQKPVLGGTHCWGSEVETPPCRPIPRPIVVLVIALRFKTHDEHFGAQAAPQKFSIKLRQLVSSKPENSQVLTIDSLDKGKMAYPAWRFGKVPSSLDLLRRPRLVSWPCRLAILN